MPTQKIGPLPPDPTRCEHPEHTPPGMLGGDPGIYVHSCPACRATYNFRVELDGRVHGNVHLYPPNGGSVGWEQRPPAKPPRVSPGPKTVGGSRLCLSWRWPFFEFR